MNADQAEALRKPFPASSVGKLPKAGTTLDYVGHAAVTDRLLKVDPEWTWEPMATDAIGNPVPVLNAEGFPIALWIRLTVCGVTRPGVGTVKAGAQEAEKQLISDAIRNAAMRFGVALDLWSKEELTEPAEGASPRRSSHTAEGMTNSAGACSLCGSTKAQTVKHATTGVVRCVNGSDCKKRAEEAQAQRPFTEHEIADLRTPAAGE